MSETMTTTGADRSVWAQVVRVSAAVSACVALGRGLVVVDRESIAIGVALLVATGLTFAAPAIVRRLGWLGVAALFVNQGVWMVGATIALTSAAPSTMGAAVPAVLSVAAVTGLAASLAHVRALADRAAMPVGLGAVAIAIALTIAVPIAGADALGAQTDDIRIATRDLEFAPKQLRAPAGDIGVIVTNDDLFWHTFTVNKFNANVNVATGGRKRLVLDNVAPGTYEFVCAIPGHEGAGMTGMLVVT
ncbi:MAG: cupredoxin domain-containing protein [Acidimicrobiales bacterium]|nr:cupredoxin domain-containing protein [Acidimicrobiales bacterium]